MRTPNQLRIDYVTQSGNWLKWIEGVQNEAYNQALQDLVDDNVLPDKEKNLKKFWKGILIPVPDVKSVETKSWNEALNRVKQEVDTTSLPVEMKELIQQMAEILKR